MLRRMSGALACLCVLIAVSDARAGANFNGTSRAYGGTGVVDLSTAPLLRPRLSTVLAGQILEVNVTVSFNSQASDIFTYINLNGYYPPDFFGGQACEVGYDYCTYSASYAIDLDQLAAQQPTRVQIGSPLTVTLIPFVGAGGQGHADLMIRQVPKQ